MDDATYRAGLTGTGVYLGSIAIMQFGFTKETKLRLCRAEHPRDEPCAHQSDNSFQNVISQAVQSQ
ncbi:MAG: hypothetical protein HRU31_05565 [Rhodobacteraceae bacterium]|nr:hypothetical protein [Paracoccaceae bacterium]